MRLSIVVVTFNSHRTIKACLDAVLEQPSDGLEVIVVDNGSRDDTLRIIRTGYPGVRLIQNEGNQGACKARNKGIAASSGDWVLTLDSDVVISPDFIEQFLAVASECADRTGMIQANILGGDGRTVYSQGIHLTAVRRFHDFNRGQKVAAVFPPRPGKIIGPCSAAAFYRRSMLEAVKEPTGYFDERFFFLVEDVDLAWRANRAGWGVVYGAKIVCRHDGNGSGTGGGMRQYLCIRNRYLMIRKNERWWKKILIHGISFPYEVLRLGYLFLFNRHRWQKRDV